MALRCLENAVELAPGALHAHYTLARVLHEKGKTAKAVKILEDTLSREEAPRQGVIHRLLVRYDSGDEPGCEEDIERLGDANLLAPGLRCLLRAWRGDWDDVSFPSLALWNPELAGRALALLEQKHCDTVTAAEDPFHHPFFCPPPKPATKRRGGKIRNPLTRLLPKTLRTMLTRLGAGARWSSSVDRAFAAKRFKRVLCLWEMDVPENWKGVFTSILVAYSRYALFPGPRAVKLVRQSITKFPNCAELHFLHGLCLIRSAKVAEAGHAFTRAARLDDTLGYAFVKQLAKHLRLPLTLEQT